VYVQARPFLDGDDEVLKMVDPALGGEYSDEQLRDVGGQPLPQRLAGPQAKDERGVYIWLHQQV
jgi:hypothetical protein